MTLLVANRDERLRIVQIKPFLVFRLNGSNPYDLGILQPEEAQELEEGPEPSVAYFPKGHIVFDTEVRPCPDPESKAGAFHDTLASQLEPGTADSGFVC
ncbi:MAG: hypothetical protein OXD34_05140 [bacterium]|nr:hypothetical protein [bacterium]